jgi:hypothetical protein
MISFNSRPIAAMSGFSLLVLAACSPATKPYEPEAPAPAALEAPQPEPEVVDSVEAEIPAAGEVEDADPALDSEPDHAGEPHVHGGGDLSITQEDDFLTLTLDAPLANFGLSESKAPSGTKSEEYANGIAEPIGPTECEETERSVTGRTDGSHGAMTISVVWRCAKIDRVEGMQIHLFDLYPAFQHVDAIYLGPAGEQVAKELTPTDTEIDFD